MITPSFGLTATERVLPRLALDFTTASLDSRITFTRSLNTATVTNSSGYIAPINADLPRFDFNPITLACRGLLIEEARTNICLQSADFATTWTLLGATVSTNQINSPSNTLTADKIIIDNGAATGSGVTQTITAAATTYTFSVFAKIGEFNRVGLLVRDNASAANNASVIFSLVDGSITTAAATAGTFTGASATSTLVANGFYRVTLTFTSTGATALRTRVTVYDSVATTGDGTKGIYAWGAQLEAGAFATSYIPTTTASVLRNADVATMTGTNFSDWYNQPEGALSCEFAFIGYDLANRDRMASITDATGNEEIGIIQNSTNGYGRFEVVDGGANQALLNCINTTMVAGTTYQICGTYKINSFCGSGSLGSQATDASGTIPTPDRMCIGGNGPGTTTAIFNGHIKSINYWPQRITNNETLAFAKI